MCSATKMPIHIDQCNGHMNAPMGAAVSLLRTSIPKLVEKKGLVKSIILLRAELMLKLVTAISATPLSRSPTNPVHWPPLTAPYFPSPTMYRSNSKFMSLPASPADQYSIHSSTCWNPVAGSCCCLEPVHHISGPGFLSYLSLHPDSIAQRDSSHPHLPLEWTRTGAPLEWPPADDSPTRESRPAIYDPPCPSGPRCAAVGAIPAIIPAPLHPTYRFPSCLQSPTWADRRHHGADSKCGPSERWVHGKGCVECWQGPSTLQRTY